MVRLTPALNIPEARVDALVAALPGSSAAESGAAGALRGAGLRSSRHRTWARIREFLCGSREFTQDAGAGPAQAGTKPWRRKRSRSLP